MTPRLATALMFVVNGATVGIWLASIPAIQRELRASATEMGIIMLAAAAGALVAMPLTGQVLTRVSSRRVLVMTALLFPLMAPLPLMAGTTLSLGVTMILFGAVQGAMDVAMNAHGVALEQAQGRPIMSSLHAGWSIGGMLGAACVALAIAIRLDPVPAASIAGALLWGLALVASRRIKQESTRSADAGGIALPSRAVLPLGLLAIAVAVVEGGLSDWSGIYLRSEVDAQAELAALAFAAFALGMTIGRLSGDTLNQRIGAVNVVRAGLLLTAASLATLLVVGSPVMALVGLVLAGVGVANGLPLMFAAAGRVPPYGPSLSAVFTMAYVAFLAGPPIVGFLADQVGLPFTLSLLVLVAIGVAWAADRVPGIARPAPSIGRVPQT